MDVLLLCITILMALIVFGVSFYMLVIYIHTDEKGIGNSIPAKIVVVLGLGLSWGQLLLVPLDVSNALDDGGIDMPTCYTVIYIIVLVYLVGLSPFTMFFYESDEEDTICSRLTWSFIFTFIIAGISCAAIFVSQIWLSVYAPG
jgi:LMBR1 domain-containing protein 1